MTRSLFPILSLWLSLPIAAATLDDVRRELGQLRGAAPLHATVEVHRELSGGERKQNQRITVQVESTASGMRIFYPAAELQRAAEHEVRQQGESVFPVNAVYMSELVNQAPALLRDLQFAKVVKAVPSRWQNQPVTAIELRLERPKTPEASKYIRSQEETMTLWVAADGTPLAAEKRRKVKGRVLVVSFEGSQTESLHFTRVADRLVATRAWSIESGSGFGQSRTGKTTTTLTVR